MKAKLRRKLPANSNALKIFPILIPSKPPARTSRSHPKKKFPLSSRLPLSLSISSSLAIPSGAIARTFGVTLDAILAVNDIPDPNALLVGQRITIPVAATPAETTPQLEATPAQEIQPPAGAALPAEDPAPSLRRRGRRDRKRRRPRPVAPRSERGPSTWPARRPYSFLNRHPVSCDPQKLPVRCTRPVPGHSSATYVGEWRSPAARFVRDEEVGGSNPLSPTTPPPQFPVSSTNASGCSCLSARVRLGRQSFCGPSALPRPWRSTPLAQLGPPHY